MGRPAQQTQPVLNVRPQGTFRPSELREGASLTVRLQGFRPELSEASILRGRGNDPEPQTSQA